MKTTSHGFTITELIVAMAMSLFVSLAGWGFYSSQLKSLSTQSNELDAAESARSALAFMAYEIRLAGLDPLDTAFATAGLTGVSQARSSRMDIQFDRDSSGDVDDDLADPAAESVSYTYDAANQRIVRTVDGDEQALIRNVPLGGLSFVYYDKNGNLLPFVGSPLALSSADRDRIAVVAINVQVQKKDSTITLSARSTLRNRVLERL